MSSDNAILYYEAAQSAVAMVALSDSGDQTFFESADALWSKKSGYEPDVKPDGLVTGGVITPGITDKVSCAAATVYQSGVLQSVVADTALAVARPTLAYVKYSITIDDSQDYVAVKGAEHATAWSDVRAADGGPPLIPVGSIEVGQVWISSASSAVFTASEIKQIRGDSQERWDYPVWTENRSNVEDGVIGLAGVTFVSALPASHTGAIPKGVFAAYYEPEFAEAMDAYDFKPPATTHSTNSQQVYGRTLGSESSTLNQGSFSIVLNDGISDAILKEKNSKLWFKFKQNRLSTPYILAQGKFGIDRSFSASDNPMASCTISALEEAVDVVA